MIYGNGARFLTNPTLPSSAANQKHDRICKSQAVNRICVILVFCSWSKISPDIIETMTRLKSTENELQFTRQYYNELPLNLSKYCCLTVV